MRFFCLYREVIAILVMVGVLGGCKSDSSSSSNLQEETVDEVEKVPPRFALLSPAQTQIDFKNTLTEGLNTNILMYEYFYNGGGVATGDLNGDGWEDIYFTSNMGENALYLNQGEMKFQKVEVALGRSGPWKTGVSLADVNGDGKLDIYLCYSGSMPEEKRKNQLFINQGNNAAGVPSFSEEAEVYGLASPAFSNQGYFVDYDQDGDLDMLLLNHNPKSLPILNEASTKEFLQQDDPLRGVRVYRNTQGKFSDITRQAGVVGSGLCYGLGLGITDVNSDGWMDFYVSNDYAVPDYLYINNQNGTFSNRLPESMGHNSHFSMGNDAADVNNDGLSDVVTLDMLPEDNRRQKLLMAPDNYAKFDLNVRSGFHYQYMRNMLQLNNGDGTFSEIGQLAGISNTDWSWAALLADYDNDGWKDLYITNGYYRDYTNLDFINYMDSYVQAKGRLVRQDVLEIIGHMPSSDVVNYMYTNQGGMKFENITREWGLYRPSNSNGAAYADLDKDGDLDLVVSNINQTAFVYENQSNGLDAHNYLQIELKGEGMNTQGIGAKVLLAYKGKKQLLEQIPTRGYLSSVSPILHTGLGRETVVDTLIVTWASGKQELRTGVKANQRVVVSEAEANEVSIEKPDVIPLFKEKRTPVNYRHTASGFNDFDRQPLLISEMSFDGPTMIPGDINGDGKADVIIGGAAGSNTAVFMQVGEGRFQERSVAAFSHAKASEDSDLLLADIDRDGDQDLYVASGGYHRFQPDDLALIDRVYLNDGKGNFSHRPDALPIGPHSTGAVAAEDINDDGHVDLFVGGRMVPGRYPEIPPSFLLVNDGTGKFLDMTADLCPEMKAIGMVTDAEWADLDRDGTTELIVIGEWMSPIVFSRESGKLVNRTSAYFDKTYEGWWNTLYLTDVNHDSIPDLWMGNMGTNTQFKVSEHAPAEIYFKDFDSNGSVDPLFCYYIQGNSYPYITRDELTRQLVEFRPRFTSFESYADVSLTELFPREELNSAERLQATHMETSLFLGSKSGKFELASLPLEVQYAPIYAIQVLDVDQDGNKDVVLCGNNSHTKLRIGKLDANYGMLLLGDGQGSFSYVSQTRSGFQLKGDVRSIVYLNNTLLVGRSNLPLTAYAH